MGGTIWFSRIDLARKHTGCRARPTAAQLHRRGRRYGGKFFLLRSVKMIEIYVSATRHQLFSKNPVVRGVGLLLARGFATRSTRKRVSQNLPVFDNSETDDVEKRKKNKKQQPEAYLKFRSKLGAGSR